MCEVVRVCEAVREVLGCERCMTIPHQQKKWSWPQLTVKAWFVEGGGEAMSSEVGGAIRTACPQPGWGHQQMLGFESTKSLMSK